MRITRQDLGKIKLIIWDLDETFWQGTLSDNNEGGKQITPIDSNITLVRKLTDRGIVNAVCSKNNKEDAESVLKSLDILDCFVFNSINWEPKGNRIKRLIKDMALRPANVLFIDDNKSNLNEAEFVMPDIFTSLPDFIPEIIGVVDELGKDDSMHTRLNQYKILETKRQDEAQSSSNIDFLRASDIKICIKTEGLEEEKERIEELIQRSNQLNFTKKRISIDELTDILSNIDYKCGTIAVKDKYGSYGMVGFYAVINNTCEHFLFSCRTMGMGIEQYVYTWLGCPKLNVIGDVSGSVIITSELADYICRVDSLDKVAEETNTNNARLQILMKGPCDLEVMRTYLIDGDYEITTEFNFVDSKGNQADFYNHSTQILNSIIPDEVIRSVTSQYHFISEDCFKTTIFSGLYDIICLSPMMDATLSVYRRKSDNLELPFGLYNCPITETNNWEKYIKKQVMTAHCDFNLNDMQHFSEAFMHEAFEPDSLIKNFNTIIQKVLSIKSSTKFVILLLPELEFKYKEGDDINSFAGKEAIHRSLNLALRKAFTAHSSVYLLDVNNYIKSQDDYFDSINHFSKVVYYKMAADFSQYAKQLGYNIATKSYLRAYGRNKLRAFYRRYILHTGKLETIVQAINKFVRRIK